MRGLKPLDQSRQGGDDDDDDAAEEQFMFQVELRGEDIVEAIGIEVDVSEQPMKFVLREFRIYKNEN